MINRSNYIDITNKKWYNDKNRDITHKYIVVEWRGERYYVSKCG